jgi:hypothetical protein
VLLGRHPRWALLRRVVQRDVQQTLAAILVTSEVYARISYAPTLPDGTLMRQAWRAGQRLRWQLWRLWALST